MYTTPNTYNGTYTLTLTQWHTHGRQHESLLHEPADEIKQKHPHDSSDFNHSTIVLYHCNILIAPAPQLTISNPDGILTLSNTNISSTHMHCNPQLLAIENSVEE